MEYDPANPSLFGKNRWDQQPVDDLPILPNNILEEVLGMEDKQMEAVILNEIDGKQNEPLDLSIQGENEREATQALLLLAEAPVHNGFIYDHSTDTNPWIRNRTRPRMVIPPPQPPPEISNKTLLPITTPDAVSQDIPISTPRTVQRDVPIRRRIDHIPRHAHHAPQTAPRVAQLQPPAQSRAILIHARPLRTTAKQRLTKAMKSLATACQRKRS